LRLVVDGRPQEFGNGRSALVAMLVVHDPSFFAAVVRDGEIGLGESYVQGKWTSPDLDALGLVLMLNVDVFLPMLRGGTVLAIPLAIARTWSQRRIAARRETSLANSRTGMSVAYDVGNDFFRRMLGPSRFYSCAIYPHAAASLEEAQAHKVDVIMRKAGVAPGYDVLDIGCGWGTLLQAIHARHGCRIHGISLAKEQIDYCRTAVPEGRFDCIDYRELAGEALYDRIVSVGMIEHVGLDQLPVFAAAVARLLKPGGRAVLHTMIVGDTLDLPPGEHLSAFATRHIMPVGYVPRADDLVRAIVGCGDLRIVHQERFGPHYGRTMRAWRQNVLRESEAIAAAYSIEHVRAYDYLWAVAAACFTSTAFDLLQVVVDKGPIDNAAPVYDPRM
jgi:cyclopropane-fatty-acyl-phospholipid synthase